jgi:hypothetical protein
VTVLLDLEPRETGTEETDLEFGFDEAECRRDPSRRRHEFAEDPDFSADWLFPPGFLR